METYHKIQTLFKRHLDGPKKGKLIVGDWARPEIGYLADLQWEFTEKVDGTNIRVELTRKGDVFEVAFAGRSDNAQIPGPLSQHLEYLFDNGSVYQWMLDNDLEHVMIFGEGYGNKIQNGGLYVKDNLEHNRAAKAKDPETTALFPEQIFVIFDVKIGGFWLDRDNVNDVADKLGIMSVPVIGYGTLHDAIEIVTSGLTWDRDGKLTKWHGGSVKRGLRSTWGDFEAEGIVARPMQPLFNRKGERIITKIKGVDFK